MVVEDRLMVDHGAFKMREWRLQHFGFHLCISEKLDAHRNPVLAPPRHLSAPAAKGIAKSEFQRMKAVSAMQKAMPKSTRERSHLLSSFIIVYVQWDCTQMSWCFRTRQKLWWILWRVPTPLKLDWSQVQIGIARDHQIDLERKKRMVALQVPNWADYTAAAVVIHVHFFEAIFWSFELLQLHFSK